MLVGNPAQPSLQRGCGLPIPAPDALYTATDLPERECAEENLLLRKAIDPGNDFGVRSIALPQLGRNVRIDQEAQRSTGRP